MIYTHVINRGGLGVRSPVDGLAPVRSGPGEPAGIGREPSPPIPAGSGTRAMESRRDTRSLPAPPRSLDAADRPRAPRGERD
jgi:hypothetical protein